MLLVKVIKDSVIYKGDIKKLDVEFECDKAIAESLIERGFVVATALVVDETALVVDEEPTAEEVEMVTGHLDAGQFEGYSYKELQGLAKEMGLNAGGTKEELIARITAEEVQYPVNDDDADEAPMTSMPE